MHLRTYRYGEARGLTGLSVGVTRQVPRGVKKEDYVRGGYFDVWLPMLSPSKELVAGYMGGKIPWQDFAKRYRKEMSGPDARSVIRLIAAMAAKHPVNLGCFCEDESRCHRSLLYELAMAEAEERGGSPPCDMPEVL
jgi:uncharacterized protein YeaO (DUF488 family)